MRDLQRTIARRRSFDAHLDHSDRRLPSACVGRRRCQSAAPGICRPRRRAVQVLAAVGVVVGSTTAAGVACRARDDRHRTMRFTSSCLRGYATPICGYNLWVHLVEEPRRRPPPAEAGDPGGLAPRIAASPPMASRRGRCSERPVGSRCPPSPRGAQPRRRRICPPRPRCLLTPPTHKLLCPPSGRASPRRASPNARVVGACVGFWGGRRCFGLGGGGLATASKARAVTSLWPSLCDVRRSRRRRADGGGVGAVLSR